MADGKAVDVTGKGNVSILARLPDGSQIKIDLVDILYKPTFASNLFSVIVVMSKGFKVLFSERECKVYSNSQHCLTGTKDHNLVVLDTVKQHALLTQLLAMTTLPLPVWHKRLGHLGLDNVKKMEDMVTGMEIENS